MKTITLLIALATMALAVSCKGRGGSLTTKSERVELSQYPITERDLSINADNSYNNLFIDSAIVSNYADSCQLSDTLRRAIISFYNSRNFQYAWFSKGEMTEQGALSLNQLKYLNYRILDSASTPPILYSGVDYTPSAKLELEITKQLYALHRESDIRLYETYIPKRRYTIDLAIDAALNNKEPFPENSAPHLDEQYKKLKQILLRYAKIRYSGGWKKIEPVCCNLKFGAKAAEVKALKIRLKREGFLNGIDSLLTEEYDSTLVKAVSRAEERYGLNSDGIVDTTLIKELNITIDERIKQILINIERAKWLPSTTAHQSKTVVVNIPEYRLHIYNRGKKISKIDIIVGESKSKTILYAGKITNIILNPVWNIPQSITEKELLPKIEEDSTYLERNHITIIGIKDGIPILRQEAGEWNSLGRIKFIFPNRHYISLHDTPSKSSFAKERRDLSHGCIRVKEPIKFAQFLLSDRGRWSASKIEESISSSSKERYIPLEEPVPILLSYLTAWIDENNTLHFRKDIYDYDKKMGERYFTNHKR